MTAIRKGWNIAICDIIDESGMYCAKWSVPGWKMHAIWFHAKVESKRQANQINKQIKQKETHR